MAHPISEVLQAFAAGEIVVVTDDDDREGEGDLIVAATLCTPEKMAFIIRHTSGIVCAPITADNARRLRLDPMVAQNDSNHTTAFTVSIDYKPGMTTGISADERTACCRALANPNAGPGDFARPGHIFPLIARDGGVLLRSGHTEAAVDLCKMCDLPPVGVISELMNDDGTVMKGEQVVQFAAKHGLKHNRQHGGLQSEEESLNCADIAEYRVDPAQRHDGESAGQHEQNSRNEAALGLVHEPADIDGKLLRLGSG